MTLLLLGIVVFIGTHSVAILPTVHGRAVSALGAPIYKGVYSLLSVAGLVLIIEGFGVYRSEGLIEVWSPPTALKHLNSLFMLISFVSLASAYTPFGYIKRRLKHPMLVGVKAWAFGHFLANGDLGGMILFGSLLAWAVIDRISFKWRPMAFVDVPEPRIAGDMMAVAIGLIAFFVMIQLHPIIIGVPVMG